MELPEVLKEYGFDDQEGAVYLFLLRHGGASQQTISDRLQILRQTIYDLVKRMLQKGYLSSTLVGKRKYYCAVEPRILLTRLREHADRFEGTLPAFEAVMNTNEHPWHSQTFVGKEGLKNIFERTLEQPGEVLWLCNKTISDQVFKRFYWHNYAAKRLQKGISIKLLFEPTKKTDWNTDQKLLREGRRHELLRGTPSSFVLWQNKLILYTAEKECLHGVFIEDASLKQLLERLFMQLWNKAK